MNDNFIWAPKVTMMLLLQEYKVLNNRNVSVKKKKLIYVRGRFTHFLVMWTTVQDLIWFVVLAIPNCACSLTSWFHKLVWKSYSLSKWRLVKLTHTYFPIMLNIEPMMVSIFIAHSPISFNAIKCQLVYYIVSTLPILKSRLSSFKPGEGTPLSNK